MTFEQVRLDEFVEGVEKEEQSIEDNWRRQKRAVEQGTEFQEQSVPWGQMQQVEAIRH